MPRLPEPEELARAAFPLPVTPYGVEASRGRVKDVGPVDKFGANGDVDTGTVPEDVWSQGLTWAKPTAARVHSLTGHANDTLLGTGVRTVEVSGLKTWDAEETSEVVDMAGAGGANTANAYVILHRMEGLTFGSGGTNEAAILATAAADATVTAAIPAGKGQTQMAIMGVPEGQLLLITQAYVTWVRGAGAATAAAEVELLVNSRPGDADGGFVVKQPLGLYGSGNTFVPRQYDPPKRVVGPAIVKMAVPWVSADNTNIGAGFDGYLVPNP